MKKSILKIALGILAISMGSYSFAQTYTFNNCSATNRSGPTQTQVNAAYTGANTLTGNVTINTQGIQEWTVPATGTYNIDVTGAKGGNSTWSTIKNGGNGANMQGEFNLTAGQVLSILVGQEGQSAAVGGGGGGSFVVSSGTALIIAGAGGGASSDQSGVAAVTTQSGTQDSQNLIAGGTAGSGGSACTTGANNGGGGSGFSGNGMDATNGINYGRGGLSFLNNGVGGVGGRIDGACAGDPEGGFGGGGSSSCNTVAGGGGGGYSGGAGGLHLSNCSSTSRAGGGGGGSFNSGTNQTNTAGIGMGMGSVIITNLCTPTVSPTITTTCPTNITVNNIAGTCGAVVTFAAPTATDDCGTVTAILTSGLASGVTFPVGVTTNSYSIDNGIGIAYTCSFTVTVIDNEDPTISCPTDITINADAGQCTSTAAIGTATGTDNCAAPTITSNAPASFPIGNTIVTWTSTDAATNAVTCTQVVTVVDSQNPTITCPGAITINMDAGQCTSTAAIGTATGTDNCAAPTITNNAPASFPIGNTTVTWTSTDAATNFVTCTQIVTVVDAENPTISCPNDITINMDASQCTSTASIGTATGTDNCTAPIITSDAPASFSVGNTTVTWTSTDAANNAVTCTQVVTVIDAENPTITCPADITINMDASQCTSTASIGTATGTDNCTAPIITSDAPASFSAGNTTVTWTSTDAANNAVTCTQVVTVIDAENPTITCSGNITSCDTIVNGITPLSTGDNCVGEFVTYTLSGATTATGIDDASGTVFNVGTTTVLYTVTDSAGNNDNCSFDVTVHPITSVTIDPFSPDTICWNATAFNLSIGSPIGGTYSGLGVVDTMFNPDTSGVGSHYIVYTFTDANSCVHSDSTMITVDLCTGVNENTSFNNVNIYPNPTNGLVHINLGDNNGAINYTISTIEGRIVNQKSNVTTNKMTINLSNESKGIYFLRIENNTSSKVYKIIRK